MIHGIQKDYNIVPIFVNDLLCIRKELVQVKFPKSKKKRIRNKWKKRNCNFGLKDMHFMVKFDNKVYVSSKMYEKLQYKIPYPDGSISIKKLQINVLKL
jgi:hypothetical protein